jgi:hypothetical protein
MLEAEELVERLERAREQPVEILRARDLRCEIACRPRSSVSGPGVAMAFGGPSAISAGGEEALDERLGGSTRTS